MSKLIELSAQIVMVIVAIIILLAVTATVVGIVLIAAGFVWLGVESVWGMIV